MAVGFTGGTFVGNEPHRLCTEAMAALGLTLIGWHRAREHDTAQPRDEVAVEAEVIGVLYGDSSARRRAHDTHTVPGRPPNLQPSAVQPAVDEAVCP